uniref:Kazal-like domain-containing protein n=1 Tax=Neovison vison TaxID=452646 RepID=A0A8C7AWR8_NEOVI
GITLTSLALLFIYIVSFPDEFCCLSVEMVDCTQYPPENKYCTREWDPVCASNGRTYGNPCTFCRGRGDHIYFLHFGTC